MSDVWIGDSAAPSQRLIDAIACGEVTEGGLAEARLALHRPHRGRRTRRFVYWWNTNRRNR